MNFSDFVGNERLKDDFLYSLRHGTAGQSYLIEGPAGSGKKTFATLMAKALLCDGPIERRPCGVCSHCLKIEGGNHPDFVVVSPAKDKVSVSVEVVRTIREGLYILPNEGEKRIYLIPDAEALTVAAQNALLKAFEEPPPFAVFILTVKNAQEMLPTIVSRAIRLKTSPLSKEQVADDLKKNVAASRQEIESVANLCAGNIGMARSMLKNKFLEEVCDFFGEYTKILAASDRAAYFSCCSFLEKNKGNIAMILELFLLWIRDILIYKESGEPNKLFFSGRVEAIELGASFFTKKTLLKLSNITQKTIDTLDSNANFSSALIVMQINSWEEIH